MMPYQDYCTLWYSLPCFPSTDKEKTPSFCLFAQVATCVSLNRGLPVVDFWARAFLCEGNARGEIDSMAQVSDFYKQMSQVASTGRDQQPGDRCACQDERTGPPVL